MAPKPSSRMRTVDKLLDAYGSLSVPTLLEPLADDFNHRVLPESLEMPARDKESFSQHASQVFGIFDKFQMIPLSIYEDTDSSAVVVHARMQGTLKRGANEWRNECIMMIRLSADGNKVVEITEFVDSAKAQQMRQKHAPKVFQGKATPIGRIPNLMFSFGQIILICILYQLALILAFNLSKPDWQRWVEQMGGRGMSYIQQMMQDNRSIARDYL
ncbi:hypothetical protein BKA67DRAFT_563670 [Truncatella angustata]|uniref:Uncharacterized protein n=1 Tax=Truncatella angustata TaxID=152316 RepID=A0A9P8UKT2_9PEZI|nr:uncharacterized protein BKA67DRAFT_563670 [Truncatella angustata]KAH6653934.1 hypothetical protein BKA67DRAFT_563670 [Truncatella angustata]KAH8198031.1 hypothetical protein TruAng_007806 [Truncatella angustata]